jgi:predicted Zn-ribbon and HTH transcriptional regulator
MDLNTVLFGGITLKQFLIGAAAVFVVLKLLHLVMKPFSKPKATLQHVVYHACKACGWEGQMSKFGTQCPKCNHPV